MTLQNQKNRKNVIDDWKAFDNFWRASRNNILVYFYLATFKLKNEIRSKT